MPKDPTFPQPGRRKIPGQPIPLPQIAPSRVVPGSLSSYGMLEDYARQDHVHGMDSLPSPPAPSGGATVLLVGGGVVSAPGNFKLAGAPFTGDLFDPHGGWNNGTGLYTVVSDGFYRIICGIQDPQAHTFPSALVAGPTGSGQTGWVFGNDGVINTYYPDPATSTQPAAGTLMASGPVHAGQTLGVFIGGPTGDDVLGSMTIDFLGPLSP